MSRGYSRTHGTTINRVIRLTDPAASFDIETPAATALVRGTTPQVTVDSATGNSRVSNVPDNTGGLVQVRGTDAGLTTVTLQPGEETTIRPGQAPSTPTQMSSQQQQQPPFSQDQQQQTMMLQQQQMQQASAMMAGQAIAANFAAQSSLMNAAAAQQLQNQLIINQLNAAPNFPFSNINVASGTVRLR